MKSSTNLLFAIAAAFLLAAYLEEYFEHPTYGRGLTAVAAALQLARFA